MLDGVKRFITGVDVADAVLVFARTSGQDGKAQGISAFLVPVDAAGFDVPYYHWSFNMPTDHGEVVLDGVRVGDDAVVGEVDRGLDCAQLFVHENRIRQAASSLGAAQFCIDRSIAYARERVIFGKPLADYQGVQWQLVELQTEAELVRNTLYKTAWEMDQAGDGASTSAKMSVSDKVSMVNYRANRLACDAADRAIQVHGGLGYMRALPVRVHLPPPPPLPHHRGLRRAPAAPDRGPAVRLHRRRPRRVGAVTADATAPRTAARRGVPKLAAHLGDTYGIEAPGSTSSTSASTGSTAPTGPAGSPACSRRCGRASRSTATPRSCGGSPRSTIRPSACRRRRARLGARGTAGARHRVRDARREPGAPCGDRRRRRAARARLAAGAATHSGPLDDGGDGPAGWCLASPR